MNKAFSFIVISLLLLNLILILDSIEFSEGKFIDDLGNPNDINNEERILTLDGPGDELLDGTTYFEFPLGQGSVLDAELNVSVMDYDDNYPLNPIIDVGLDDDIDWQFTGTGYGQMGYQQYFNDGTTKHTASFTNPNGGTDLSSTVQLPRSAQVSAANASLRGRFSQPDFQSYKYQSDLGLQGVLYVAMGDINNDGWDDAVVTSETLDKVVWYENDGTPLDSEWFRHEITSNLKSARSLDIGDMDSDGDLDVVATSYDPSNNYGIYWYENLNTTNNSHQGNGSAWQSHRIDSKTTYTYSPRCIKVADLDLDGDNDTVVGSYDTSKGGVYWYENVHGNGSNWTVYTIYHESNKDNRVTDIDVKNINHAAPHRLDVAAALNGQQWAVWFENDGDPVNTTGDWVRHNVYSRPYTYCLVIADMNGDNKNDVVVGYERSYGIYWYRAPNDVVNASTWNSNYYVSWIWYLADLDVGNINNDNYPDIVATSSSWDYIYFYRNNNAAGTSFSSYIIEYNFRGPYGIDLCNVDKDANGIDIVVCGRYSSEIRWYRNGGGSNPKWDAGSIEEISLYGPQGLFSADIDKDGNKDMIITGNRGGDVVWLEAPNDPTDMSNWTLHMIDNNLGNVLEVFVEDIDGDGWLDVAVTAQYPTNKVVWYKCPANPAATFNQWTMTEVDSYLYYAWGVHIADIDDDGDNDIVSAGRYANKVYWYRNNDVSTPGTGDGLSWTRFTIDSNLNYASSVWVEDMDSDGDLDVVAGSASWSSGSAVVWYEAPNDPTTTWVKYTVDNTLRYVYDVHVADIDQDGNPDIISAPYYDRYLRWHEAPDNPKTGTWVGHNIWTSQYNYLYAYNLWVDDIGNDGYYDIVVGVEGFNSVWWFEAPDEPAKAGSWTRYLVDPSISQPRGVFIEDVDSDGIKDVLASGWGSNQVNWYEVSISYPLDVSLEIDSTEIFFKSGELNKNTQHSNDFTSVVNSYLANHQDSFFTDEYGNEFINLKIAIKTQTEGRITIEDVDIEYDYTALVKNKPDSNLAWEITDLIPNRPNGTARIYIGFKSEVPCKVKIGDLKLEYNGAPDVQPMEDRSILEDTTNSYLYDLRDFFDDDYQLPDELYYGIKSYTNSEFIDIRVYKRYYLSINSTKSPHSNWNGESDVIVYAYDHEMIYTYSEQFTIKILPVDDPPEIKNEMPDLMVLMNTTNSDIDLDRLKRPFFTDVDSEKLYYFIHVDEKFKNNISLNLSTEKILEVSAIGGPIKNITVTVYCDDEPIQASKYQELKVYQTFQVEVLEIIDEAELIKPRWRKLPDCTLKEDHPGKNNWIYLPNYVVDYDDDPKTLEYTIVSISNNGYLEVVIDDDNNIDILPIVNFDGVSEVVLKARDSKGNYGIASFKIFMIPINDPPVIEIRQPLDGSRVINDVLFNGYAEDIEGLEVSTQIKFGPNTITNPWLDITNITKGFWYFPFDVSTYTEPTKLTVTVRAYDGELYSENESIKIIIDNTLKDSDGDGYSDGSDAFPFDIKEWKDTDNDGVGDNTDAFVNEPTQWSDIDDDGYGDNPKGKGFDHFPYDPTQFKDKDGDGYGDNPNGNNPDYYPYDKQYHAEGSMDGDQQEGFIESMAGNPLLPYLIMAIILIIVNLYLFTYLFMARSGKLEERRREKEEQRKQQKQQEEEEQQKQKASSESGVGSDQKQGMKDQPQLKGKQTQPLQRKPTMRPIVYYPGDEPPPPAPGFGPAPGQRGMGMGMPPFTPPPPHPGPMGTGIGVGMGVPQPGPVPHPYGPRPMPMPGPGGIPPSPPPPNMPIMPGQFGPTPMPRQRLPPKKEL
jgi:hypothetical protein